MPDPIDVLRYPAQPPQMMPDGETPLACPRCGGIFERPLPGIPGHPVGHPKLCPPMVGMRSAWDARERKAGRRG